MRTLNDLIRVNETVNRSVGYKTDIELYGTDELWTVANREGDCEDYALTKRRLLLGLGWPLETLRLATCWVETGEYHAVLTADHDGQTWVLDNRHKSPRRWDRLPYRWHKRQKAGGTGWVIVS